MTLDNLIYKIKNEISPFKTAVVTVIISVVASVCVSAVSETGKQIISGEMDSIGLNGFTAVMYNSKGENVTDEKFVNRIRQIYGVEDVSPVITENVSAKFTNGVSVSALCWGISPDITNVIALENIEGRMINKTDIENNSKVCLVDENVAVKVYKRNNICGKKILVEIEGNVSEFTVIGTIRKNSNVLNSITGDVIPDFIYIPYSTMMNLSAKSAFDQIVLNGENVSRDNEKIKEKLSEMDIRYKNNIIKVTDMSQQKKQIIKISDTAFFALFMVSCVAVVVCSLSVAGSINTAVVSRQKDIGIKMSMGASCFNIIAEFMISAVLSCILGVIIAAILIYIGIKIVSVMLSYSIAVNFNLIAYSIFATIMLTTIFSFLPSYKAAKMPPIKALNRE